MTETALTIISVIGTISSILFAYLAFSRNKQQDNEKDGQHNGTILTEIGYIKSGVDDIKKKQEAQDQRHIEVISRLATVEASAKQAHKRIDTLYGQAEKEG